MKIKCIKPAGIADVYNMEVEDTHNFCVNSGVIVHNCRYVMMEHPLNPRRNIRRDIPEEDPLNMFTKKKPENYYFYKL